MKMKYINKAETINSDIMPLDTRIKHEYDIERALKYEYDNEDTIPLDIRKGSKYDKRK